jgi:hypothetical protein
MFFRSQTSLSPPLADVNLRLQEIDLHDISLGSPSLHSSQNRNQRIQKVCNKEKATPPTLYIHPPTPFTHQRTSPSVPALLTDN